MKSFGLVALGVAAQLSMAEAYTTRCLYDVDEEREGKKKFEGKNRVR